MLLHYHSRKFHPHALPRARSNGGTGDWTTRASRAAPWWILYRTAQTLLSDARHCCLLAHHRAAHCAWHTTRTVARTRAVTSRHYARMHTCGRVFAIIALAELVSGLPSVRPFCRLAANRLSHAPSPSELARRTLAVTQDSVWGGWDILLRRVTSETLSVVHMTSLRINIQFKLLLARLAYLYRYPYRLATTELGLRLCSSTLYTPFNNSTVECRV